jgi:hypothetical protein
MNRHLHLNLHTFCFCDGRLLFLRHSLVNNLICSVYPVLIWVGKEALLFRLLDEASLLSLVLIKCFFCSAVVAFDIFVYTYIFVLLYIFEFPFNNLNCGFFLSCTNLDSGPESQRALGYVR